MKKILLSVWLLALTLTTLAQSSNPYEKDKTDAPLNANTSLLTMPYNRMVESAGKVLTYGNPELENHTLDVTVMPGNKLVVVEDRYGIAIINASNNKIIFRWSFDMDASYRNMLSTYSGIKSFVAGDSTYIVWGAASPVSNVANIMVASWADNTVMSVSSIPVETERPAKNALPNDIAVKFEGANPYLYVTLNGNNQLAKINFTNRQVQWLAPTGVAPFGVKVIGNKAYVTNWAGPLVTDSTLENAGTPWGRAYTNPITGATARGSLSVIDITTGKLVNELPMGLHPNAIITGIDNKFLYIANGNSDFISVVDVTAEKVIDSINVGLFSQAYAMFGSSPNALSLDAATGTLYVANGLDNAVAVISLGKKVGGMNAETTTVAGYIPTQAYPSGLAIINGMLYVTNLEAGGANVQSPSGLFDNIHRMVDAYSIHKQIASISCIPLPAPQLLASLTEKVRRLNLSYRLVLTNQPPRKDRLPQPLPERIGEPSIFKHVVYIIKENKTYDQVFGDMAKGRGERSLCIFGEEVTPNQHQLARDFSLMDNYYASGKSSAEGHQWTDAAMVSDYIAKNVRAWFRSYPHRQADALVYNKSGFIWNNALDHGKKVRVYGEACTTQYDRSLNWSAMYQKQIDKEPVALMNTTTIARLRPVISPTFPDCDNLVFSDQLRADIFIDEFKKFEAMPGDELPHLMLLSLPNDHTVGMAPNFPTPKAMVADNDLAVGRIVETITNSRFWDSTVIFITQDDSQSGWDHISSYRTTGLVISPYSNLRKTIHTNYNQTSMVRTIEQILGLPPMNIIDATALPMFDCFTITPTKFAYKAIPNKVALNEMNKPLSSLKGKALYYAKQSANEVFNEVDGGEDDTMNRILWFDAKGLEKYPVVAVKK